jgi:flagellar basal-body rod protein FlgB
VVWDDFLARAAYAAQEDVAESKGRSTGKLSEADTTGMDIKPAQFDLLSKLVDTAALRHRVLAHNVANVNTPGYQRLNVNFEESLAKQLRRNGKVDLDTTHPEITLDEMSPRREDGNNVDIDREMGAISKNNLLHNTYLQIINFKVGQMRQAIGGRS